MDDAQSKTQVLARELINLLHAGDTTKAKNKLMGFNSEGKEGRFIILRLLISYSQDQNDYVIAEWVLENFKQMESKSPKDDSGLFYDIANGYQVLYEISVKEKPANAFEREDLLRQAINYFEKAGKNDPRALTNFGNLYDSIGRPVEALACYDYALARDKDFGMALGNKALALEIIAPVAGNLGNTYLIHAYQLYCKAISNEASIKSNGSKDSADVFREHMNKIEEYFKKNGKADALKTDFAHAHPPRTKLKGFAEFYTDFCLSHNLYLNLHLSNTPTDADVGDSIFPSLITGVDQDDRKYVEDIAVHFNEISESFMTARVALAQSQYKNADFTAISEQTTLVNNLDYSVSNIYVGHLKMAYKEAFSVLDKIAGLLNHYLDLGHDPDSVYYRNVWFEKQDNPKNPPRLLEKVKNERYLVGLYLLCQDLCGSEYSVMRNALTHRHARVYRAISGPKGTYTFEELTELAIDVMFQVKCAITYLSLFITRKERSKHKDSSGKIMNMPLYTAQNLDIW